MPPRSQSHLRLWGSTVVALALLALAPSGAAAALCPRPDEPLRECSTEPPTASFTWEPSSPERGQTVRFESTSTANPDRRIRSLEWDLYDDGTFTDGTEATAQRSFGRSGPHTVRLRVTDSEGAVSVRAETLTVRLPDASLPRPRQAVSYQQNPMHDGFLDVLDPAPPLVERWSRNLGGAISFALIADRRVFVTVVEAPDGDASSAITQGSSLYALDRATGGVLWSRRIGAHRFGWSSAALDGARVFVNTGDGLVLAFDADTGRTLWARQLPRTNSKTAPVAADGLVYTGGSQSGGAVYALDQADGSLMWQQETGSGEGSSPALDGANLYASYPCPGTFGMDRLTGYAQWWDKTFCTGGSPGLTPVIHRERLYARQAGDSDKVFDRSTGKQVGSFRSDRPPVFAGDVGLFLADGTLRARDIERGQDLWSAGNGELESAPIVVGQHVYVTSRDGRLRALALPTGAETWSAPLGGRVGSDGRLPTGLAAAEGVLAVPAGEALKVFSSGDAELGPPRSPPPVDDPLAGLPAPAQAGGEARAYLQSPHHNGFANVTNPVPPLRPRWRWRVAEQRSLSYPVVAGGRVFFTEEVSEGPVGSRLHAADLVTGRRLWSREVSGDMYNNWSGAAYDAGRVFVTSEDETVRAYDPASGALLWERRLGQHGFVDAPPVAADGLVYVSRGGSGDLAALRQTDGTVAWTSGTVGGGSSSPTVGGGHVFVSNVCLWTQAFDHLSGNPRWSLGGIGCSGGGGTTSPHHDGRLYAREDLAGGYVLDETDGQIKDTFSAVQPPAFAGSLGVFLNGRVLQGEDLRTNRLLWEFGGDGQLATAPLIVGRRVYVASRQGQLFALDLGTGRKQWQGELGHPLPDHDDDPRMTFGMAAADGTLVLPVGGEMVVFESASEAPDTTITSGPSGTVRSTSATFGFSASESGSTFQCRRDGGSWAECVSPKSYSSLSQGSHTFEVAATDRAGNRDPTPVKRTWKVDTVAPRVSSASPSSGATGVSPTANVVATFSEAMKASTITRTTVKLIRKGTTTPVTATVTYDPSIKRAKLDPGASLRRGAIYTATVTTGVKDLAGNPMASRKSWSFTVRR